MFEDTATRYKEDFPYMWVCGGCFHLFEEGRPDGLEQSCHCQENDEKRWRGFDFNERASLCLCCGLELLVSGSKWSPFLCTQCELLGRGVSVWERSIIFPVGRHSLMHTWSPDARSASVSELDGDSKVAAQNLCDALRSTSKGSQTLLTWYPMRMAANFHGLGFRSKVKLTDYLLAVDREEWACLSQRLVAFDGLCEFFKSSSRG